MYNDTKIRLISMAAAAIVAAMPAIAQEATSEQPATEGTTAEQSATGGEAAAPADAGTTNESEANPESDGLGTSYVLEVSGDWQILCIKTQLEADPCRMHQLLKDQNDGAVATMEVTNIPGQARIAAGVTIVTPLDTYLKEGISMSVDGGQGIRLPFEFCTPRGCVVREGFDSTYVDSFRQGNKATLTIVPNQARNQQVPLEVSLSGFTAGFNKLLDLNTAAQAAMEKAQAANSDN